MKKFKMAIAALMLMTLAAMNVGCDDQMPAVGPNGNPNSSYNDDPPYDPPYDPQMLYVDLGLPSGTLWTYHNIGASDDYSYGQPFAWGEIETKSTFTWYTYKWSSNPNLGKGMYNLTKYCRQSSYGYNGYVDNLTTLEPSDDAAHYKCGSVYSIPTPEDWEELFANTDQEWIKKFGKSGMLFMI